MARQQDIAPAVKAERLRLCDYLETLTEADWEVRSLCSAWTVREVVAHLTLATRVSIRTFAVAAFRARGTFDRTMEELSREAAATFGPAELLRQLRESADATRRPPGTRPMDPLADLVIHGQDIARPLGRPHAIRRELAAPVLSFVARNRMLGAPARLEGLRIVASDADWSVGRGPQVRGTTADLLLVAAGRAGGLPDLTGPGVALLAGRLEERSGR